MPNATPTAPSLSPSALSRLDDPPRPLPIHAVQRSIREYQEGLQALVTDDDRQNFRDRDGGTRSFPKRSGWRKIAMWFTLDLFVDWNSLVVDRDEQGRPLRARVVGRAVHPNGRIAEDFGACSVDEPRQFNKPEHDIISTATTRALNRAISNLVGMGELSAEEMVVEVEPPLPDWARQAPETRIAEMVGKLTELVGKDRAELFTRALGNRYGYTPNIAPGFVNAIHSMLTAPLHDAPSTTAEGE